MALSSKTLTVTVGKKKTLKLKNNTKTVKWSGTSGKGNVTLSSKKKTSVVITGKKKGTAKVQAKVGKKSYTCTVTVKENIDNSDIDPEEAKALDSLRARAGEGNVEYEVEDGHVVRLRISGLEGSLDAGRFPKLRVLFCSKNQLTALDVSNCTVLTDLYCEV